MTVPGARRGDFAEASLDTNSIAFVLDCHVWSNNSVRVTNAFLDAVENDGDWELTNRVGGKVVKTLKARDLWQRIGEYWWLGMDAGSEESGWTGRHDGLGRTFAPEEDGKYAWSAAFISYVMRTAGAGPRWGGGDE